MDRALDLQQQHTGNVAGCRAEDGHGVKGIELIQAVKVLVFKELPCVDAAAGQNRECDTVAQKPSEADFQIEVVQLFQKAVCSDVPQLVEVVREVILRGNAADGDDVVGKRQRLVVWTAEGIAQSLRCGVLVLRTHAPEARGERAVVAGVGVGHVKDVFEPRTLAAVVDQRDTLCAAVYPAPHALIP
ncbi:MAG: hypothetical protein E7425_04160 [Ruminococcaceae bacterium]|nr:hypothetical protein [Oscillospiraceae bacterium]